MVAMTANYGCHLRSNLAQKTLIHAVRIQAFCTHNLVSQGGLNRPRAQYQNGTPVRWQANAERRTKIIEQERNLAVTQHSNCLWMYA
jgi:hypothetical protein